MVCFLFRCLNPGLLIFAFLLHEHGAGKLYRALFISEPIFKNWVIERNTLTMDFNNILFLQDLFVLGDMVV